MKFTDKKELRKEMRALRDALSKDERRVKSEQIASKVIKMQEFQNAEGVLLYWAMKSEVETILIYEEAKRLGKAIYFPRVLGDKMEFFLVDETTEFEKSCFGVLEPKIGTARQYAPMKDDVIFVLMPGIAFDEKRNRIGYGGGYYDKYLSCLEQEVEPEHICKVAVAYQCQVVKMGMIENELHDVRADYIVTENMVYN